MRTWLVADADYEDEGFAEFRAWTKKGAARQYRKATGERAPTQDLTELSVYEATPEILAARAAQAE